MEHKCCDKARWFLKYHEERNCWHVLFVRGWARYGSFQAEVEFCPWCGKHLPTETENDGVAIGDYVVKTKEGEIRVLPQEANRRDGLQYAKVTDVLVGTIIKPGKCFGDHLVEILPKHHSIYRLTGMPTRFKISEFRKSLRQH